MKVHELIDKLSRMPQDADVLSLWDGAARSEVNVVYLSKQNNVITADFDDRCYHDCDRPKDAPNEAEVRVWKTPKQ